MPDTKLLLAKDIQEAGGMEKRSRGGQTFRISAKQAEEIAEALMQLGWIKEKNV